MPTHEWARFHVEVNSNLGPEKQSKEKQEERKKLTNSAKDCCSGETGALYFWQFFVFVLCANDI